MYKLLLMLSYKLKNRLSNFIPIYNKNFFADINNMAEKAARVIVPIIYTITKPKSVIDIGCGTGYWLKYFKEQGGVEQVLGVDGNYVPKDLLMIGENEFHIHDLRKKINLENRYDIAITIEVAEHLHKKYALTFVESLTSLSDVIIFSAAIPKQSGNHHVNEKWPEYWQNIFKKFNYEAFDPIRPKILWRKDIEGIYKQNIFIFVNRESDKFSYYKKNYPNPTEMMIITKDIFVRHKPILLRLTTLYKKYILK